MPYAAAPRLRRSALPFLLAGLLLAAPSSAAPPVELDVWEPLGPEGGDVQRLVETPQGRLFAVTSGWSLWSSDDGAASWQRRDPLPEIGVGVRLLADPREEGRLYVFVGYRPAPWVSTDGGERWDLAAPGDDEQGLVDVAAFAEAGSAVLLELRSGFPNDDRLRRSADGGATWSPAGAGLPPGAFLLDVEATAGEPAVVWVAASAGLFRSLDGGASFTRASSAPAGAVTAVAAAPSDRRFVYVGYADGRVARSLDGGGTWALVRQAPEGAPAVFSLTVDPRDPATLAMLGNGLEVSQDGGGTWHRAEAGGVPTVQHALFPASASGTLLAVAGTWGPPAVPGVVGGVLASRDAGRTWASASRGLLAVGAGWVAASSAGGGPRIYVSTTGRLLAGAPAAADDAGHGLAWTEPDFLLPGPTPPPQLPRAGRVSVPAAWPEHLFYGDGYGVFESRDGGGVWAARFPDPCLAAAEPAVAPSDPDRGYLWGFFSYRACEKEDPCILFRWQGEALSCVAGSPSPNATHAFAVDARDPDRAWLVTAEDPVLFATRDGGASWQRPPEPPFVPTALAAHPLLAGVVFAGGVHGGVWRSDDGGASWLPLRAEEPGSFRLIQQLLVDPVEPFRLVARQDYAAWASDDGGRTWTALATGLPAATTVLHLAFDPAAPSVLYAALGEGGAFRLDRRRGPGACVPGPRTLCLGEGGRYRAVLAGRDAAGEVAVGRAMPFAAGFPGLEMGGFWLTRPRELDVLVLLAGDGGRPVAVRWLALTPRPFTLVVTDTATGRSRSFRHAAGGPAAGGGPAVFPAAE